MSLFTLVILLMFSAFFSCSETALTAMSKIRLAQLVEQKKRGALAVEKLRREPEKMLDTLLIGNNIVNTWASVLAASLAFEYFRAFAGESESLLVGAVAGIMTLVILVFGEIAPKNIAIRHAENIALFVAPLVLFFEMLLRPIAWILRFITRPVVYLFGKGGEAGITEDEIKMVISAGEKAGLIEQEEREMISSIFEFGDTAASEVMTPRPDVKLIEVNRKKDELLALIKEIGHSRIPVYEGNPDNIIGVVYAKDLIIKEGNSVKDYLHPVLIVPESKKLNDLMHQMQSSRSHIAVLVDEYGITSGIVTLEDILEEIVGEIHDEFEKGAKRIEQIDEKSWLMDAKLSIVDLDKEIGVKLPEGNYDTVGGFVFNRLGKVPAVGDSLKFNACEISVEKVSRRRILRVKIKKQ